MIQARDCDLGLGLRPGLDNTTNKHSQASLKSEKEMDFIVILSHKSNVLYF